MHSFYTQYLQNYHYKTSALYQKALRMELDQTEKLIKARQKVLKAVQEKTKFCSDQIALQLLARDQLIEELNQEISQLKIQLSPGYQGHQKTQEALQKIEELASQILKLKQQIETLQQKNQKIKQQKLSFENQLNLGAKQLQNEKKELQNEIEFKNKEIEQIKKQFINYQECINQLKELIEKLNQNIQQQTEKNREIHEKYFQATMRAADQQIENQGVNQILENSKKAQTSIEQMSQAYQQLQQLHDDLTTQIFSTFPSIDLLVNKLNKNKVFEGAVNDLMLLKQSILQKDNSPLEWKKGLEVEIIELRDQLREKGVQISRAYSQIAPLEEKIQSLELMLSKEQTSYNQILQVNSSQIQSLQTEKNLLKLQLQQESKQLLTALHQNNSLQLHLKQSQQKTVNLISKLQQTQLQKDRIYQNFRSLQQKQHLIDYQIQVLQKKLKTSSHYINKTNSAISIFQQQYNKKNQQIIQLKRELVGVKKQLEAFKKTPNKQELSLYKVIKEYEHQINILKDMVRSSQAQIKQRDIQMRRAKYVKKVQQNTDESRNRLPNVTPIKRRMLSRSRNTSYS